MIWLWCALAFAVGLGLGALLTNEVAWRAHRRDLRQVQDNLETTHRDLGAALDELAERLP